MNQTLQKRNLVFRVVAQLRPVANQELVLDSFIEIAGLLQSADVDLKIDPQPPKLIIQARLVGYHAIEDESTYPLPFEQLCLLIKRRRLGGLVVRDNRKVSIVKVDCSSSQHHDSHGYFFTHSDQK